MPGLYPNLNRLLGCDSTGRDWSPCKKLPRRLQQTVEFDLSLLAGLYREAGFKTLPLCLSAPSGRQVRLDPPVPGTTASRITCVAWPLEAHGLPAGPGKIQVRYGYDPDLKPALIALGILAAVSLGLVAWARHSALSPKSPAPSRWFAYAKTRSLTSWAMWIAWFTIIECYELAPRLELTFFSIRLPWIVMPVCLGVLPLAIDQVFAWLSHRVVREVRQLDVSRGSMHRLAFWGGGAVLCGAILVILLIEDVGGSVPGTLMPSILGIAIAAFLCILQMRREISTRPVPMQDGPLRQRIFELARLANVSLKGVFLLPEGRWKLMNAFAARGNIMLLSEPLIRVLSRREIDALAAHELTHLRAGHPAKIRLLLAVLVYGSLTVLVVPAVALEYADRSLMFLAAPVLIVLSFLLLRAYLRSIEWVADAGSASITGDPEALIAGLGKVHRYNCLPVDWGWILRRTESHPPTILRVQALARQAGRPVDIAALLESPDAPEEERYPDPGPTAATDRNAPLFTPQWRSAQLTISLIVGMVAVIAAMALAAVASEQISWWLALPGILFAAAAHRYTILFNGNWRVGRLKNKMRDRLAAAGLSSSFEKAEFCGVSLGPMALQFDGYAFPYLGFVTLGGERLDFVSDAGGFAIPRNSITAVRLCASIPVNGPAVCVDWAPPDGQVQTLQIRLVGALTYGQGIRLRKALLARMQAWLQSPAAPQPPFPQVAQLPPVTGIPWRKPELSALGKYMLWPFAGGWLAGQLIPLDNPFAAFYVATGASLACLLHILPFLWSRDHPDAN